MYNLKINHLFTLSLLSIGLTACGGGSSSGSSVKVYNGVFKDSTVSGLSYVSGGQKGTTGTNGEFKYEEDGSVTFSIGGVNLGTGEGKNVMTPIDLVDDGTLETPEVINRVRFLMMLDEDNDPSNGIKISSKVQTLAKTWSSISFADDTFPSGTAQDIRTEASVEDGITHTYVSSDDATDHFSDTLTVIKSSERCTDTGAFTGTYSGGESGNIALILDPTTGDIKGSLFNTDSSGNFIPVTIDAVTAINYDTAARAFTSLSTSGLKLTGNLNNSNTLEGTWVSEDDDSVKGTFKASRIGGNAGAEFRYTAVYEGLNDNDLGILAVDVASNNKITGKVYDVQTASELDVTGSNIKDNEYNEVSLSDGGNMNAYISETSLDIYGTLKEKSDEPNSFSGTGCNLN